MKLTNKSNLPSPIVRAIRNDPYHQDGDISVTGLIEPPRKRQLTIRHSGDITEDVADRIWALLGSNVHYILERAGGQGIQEQRLSMDIAGWKITGQADLYEDGIITDWKITSVWAVMNGAKDEWVQQLNLYAHLFRQAGYPVGGLQIVAILRDWSKFGGQRSHDYPTKQIVTIPIKLWSELHVLDYIHDRVRLHQKAEFMLDDNLPMCTPEERWERPTTYAIKIKGQKRAKRVLESIEDAGKWIDENVGKFKGKTLEIETRPGEAVRCGSYCGCNNFCSYYQQIKKGGK